MVNPTATTPTAGSALQPPPARIASIDILRAITMVLMIFVNDLWSLTNIPTWLEHVSADADGLGFADTIFPAFLFIVGMSIPFSVSARRQKGDKSYQLLVHIGSRTLALLVMGLFLVNGEYINAQATGMQRVVWYSLSCLSFILIWNVYPKTANAWAVRLAQFAGVGILLTLAFLYRGGEGEGVNRFSTYWWGILGLIGWSYLVGALSYTFTRGKFVPLVLVWLVFCALSIISSAHLIPKESLLKVLPNAIIGGTLPAFTLGGILTTLIFQHYRKQHDNRLLMLVLGGSVAALLILGFYTRTFWDISKIRATPPWLFVCSAFTILAFMAVYWLADLRSKASWFSLIKPGGTDTLLCYLIPYFAYAVVVLADLSLPAFLLTGVVGLLKSLVFALLCVWFAGALSRRGIRLRL
ncbi:lpg1661 family Dot/Icm T4SS effector [Nibrella viscosa]|uniref:Lpg1661 family Dot/Icm T4SS effector n=1 Tax=Nibrella viscosa TaxID=1084524 RepID=A0ABP8KNJ6_9BACT